MGAGKSHALLTLHGAGRFPLDAFVKVDPDMLKAELPEFKGYLAEDSASAATKLHRESTQMADVLFEHALIHGRDLLVERDKPLYKFIE